MGARGPKPTPTPLLDARGSWRAKTRTDAKSPLFPVDEPSCPSWLSREAKAEWRRVIKWLVSSRVVAEVNRAALTAYCICWGRMHKAEAQIKKKGEVYVSAKTGVEYQSPWVAIANNARSELVKLAAEFGMTPASAGRVSPTGASAEVEDDPAATFFKIHDGDSA